jgi:hypothetical protein
MFLSFSSYLFIQLSYMTNQFIDFHLYRSNNIIFLSGDTFNVHIDEINIYGPDQKKRSHFRITRCS